MKIFKARGYTLVELLISIALTVITVGSLILGGFAIYAAFHFLMKYW